MIAALQSVNSASAGVSGLSASLAPLQQASPASATAGKEPFGDLLKDAVGQVNRLEEQAHTAVTGLMAGSGVDVHQAMIASEKASMAFEMVLAVRNKAIQSYQSVMSMQF
jgi:flagellar hook-basal body complex protein FliE